MAAKHDKYFDRQQRETFDKVLALIDARLATFAPGVLTRFDEMSWESLQMSAAREAWALLREGVQHLKNGAPGGEAGAMTEALSKTSLRSCAFAASLGIRPPRFEPVPFRVDFTTGGEAALFFCRRLTEAAQGDLVKSKQMIQLKIMPETPRAAFGTEAAADPATLNTLKKQMVFSFNVLTETYARVCGEFKEALAGITPPEVPKPSGRSFDL